VRKRRWFPTAIDATFWCHGLGDDQFANHIDEAIQPLGDTLMVDSEVASR